MPGRQELGLSAMGIFAFRGERLVLRDVSLQVEAGGALLLTGANGAGKSTLLRVLAGLKRTDGGMVTWRGEAVSEARVAYLGHGDGVKAGLTVGENLGFPATAGWALGALGLEGLRDVPGRMLSAGQRRRVALARVVGRGAGLWVLDEPTLGLDAESVGALGRLMAGHRAQGGVVVAATHLPLPLEGAGELRLVGAGG